MALCTGWTIGMWVTGKSFEKAGAISPQNLWEGQWWRVGTSILLHGNGLHLFLNVLSLWFVGRALEPALGKRAYLFFLLASAVGGVGASLVWNDEPIFRVGISGGIAGLIGLVLALEWSLTRSVGGFLRQRNTIVVLILLLLNGAFAVYYGEVGGAQLDHAGHIGGLALGLVAGLAYYTRSGVRHARGIAVALLLLAPTLAYAAHPFRSVRYWYYRAEAAEEDDARVAAWQTVLELDPAEIPAARALADAKSDPKILDAALEAWLRRDPADIPVAAELARMRGDPTPLLAAYAAKLRRDPDNAGAAAALAVLKNDPAPLEPFGVPTRAADAMRIGGAWLELAGRRLEDDPDTARAWAAKVAEFRNAAVPGWLPFGQLAERAGLHDLAEDSFRRAYDAYKILGLHRDLWRPALARLVLLEQRAPDLSDPADFEARMELAIEAAPAEGEFRQALHGFAARAERVVDSARGDARKRMARALSRFLASLAAGEEDGSEILARLDLDMAQLFWAGAADPADPETREMAAGRFETAWRSARAAGFDVGREAAENWFREQKIPLPEPELADPEEGG